jgi:hypothetical protein
MTAQNKLDFIETVRKDIEMLKRFNIMDYSLLLGVAQTPSRRTKGNQWKNIDNRRI